MLSETRRLLEVVHSLRRKCPWDRKQTHRSLVPYLLEEAYETVEAIESGKKDAMREELGDLLLQIVLHAEIASEGEGFAFEQVARAIADKMVRRHPHVFGSTRYKGVKDHSKRWTELKAKEKPKRSLLEGIPKAMPALQLAQRYGEIAGSVGFDWKNAEQVLKKVREELRELEQEVKRRNRDRSAIEGELGDLCFALAQFARHTGLNAERAARRGAIKFSRRFERVERMKKREGRLVSDCSVAELERAWEQVKREGRG